MAEKHHSTLLQMQGVMVISCRDDTLSSQLITKIFGDSQSSPQKHSFGTDNHVIDCHPWHIENKYYSTDVHLFDIRTKDLISAQFADCVHGIVIYFDNDQELSFNRVKSWIPFINEFDPQIKLIVCDTAKDDSYIRRRDLQKWCIDNEFELIEFEPQSYSDDDDDTVDDFVESNGSVRIVQALQAHAWPYMTLKEHPQYKPSEKFSSLLTNLNERSEENDDSKSGICERKVNSLLEEDKHIFETLSKEETEDDSFEHLFSKFQDMKVKALSLEGEERRLYAEKVALAFWDAIGGDDDDEEIDKIHQN